MSSIGRILCFFVLFILEFLTLAIVFSFLLFLRVRGHSGAPFPSLPSPLFGTLPRFHYLPSSLLFSLFFRFFRYSLLLFLVVAFRKSDVASQLILSWLRRRPSLLLSFLMSLSPLRRLASPCVALRRLHPFPISFSSLLRLLTRSSCVCRFFLAPHFLSFSFLLL